MMQVLHYCNTGHVRRAQSRDPPSPTADENVIGGDGAAADVYYLYGKSRDGRKGGEE